MVSHDQKKESYTVFTPEAPITDQSLNSVNTRSVFAMQEIGRGRNSLVTFCAMMDMLTPIRSGAYLKRNAKMAIVPQRWL